MRKPGVPGALGVRRRMCFKKEKMVNSDESGEMKSEAGLLHLAAGKLLGTFLRSTSEEWLGCELHQVSSRAHDRKLQGRKKVEAKGVRRSHRKGITMCFYTSPHSRLMT